MADLGEEKREEEGEALLQDSSSIDNTKARSIGTIDAKRLLYTDRNEVGNFRCSASALSFQKHISKLTCVLLASHCIPSTGGRSWVYCLPACTR
jgi:hypothetical protein